MGTKRSYQQYCGLASALDVVGEPWTLLIIRELLMGPARYSDILANLPGLGTNLLAERLKFLVERGVAEQVDVRGTGAQLAYRLTPTGEELRPLVLGLARGVSSSSATCAPRTPCGRTGVSSPWRRCWTRPR